MNPIEEKDNTDRCLQEVLIVIDSMEHPVPPTEALDCKEEIFDRVNRKIASEAILRPVSRDGRRRFLRYASAAAAVLVLFTFAGIGYFFGYDASSHELAETLVHVDAPLGTLTKLVLADGMKVTLNGGSTLTYPTAFRDDRRVTLSGEGFFDVAKDEHKPFIVNSSNLTVKVLGTRFGFKAYEDDSSTLLTLQEGSVNAIPAGHTVTEGITLKPDQQLVVDNTTGEFQCRNVVAAEYISWKDGVVTFRDQTLQEISTVLQRKFNIKINIANDSIRKERYSAQFKYGETWNRYWKNYLINGTGNSGKIMKS